METWIKHPDYTNLYTFTEEFNGVVYCVSIIVDNSHKVVKYWPHVSSGKKRRDLEVFEDKDFKSRNGMFVMNWIRDTVFSFPAYWGHRAKGKREYFCVGWADTRRRDIYEWVLSKNGFIFMMEEGRKILMKKLS